MFKVIVSAPYMHKEKEKVSEMFQAYPEIDPVWIPVKERLEEPELVKIIEDVDAILCGDDRITPKVIDTARNLKVIVKWGTGIDSIHSEYAKQKGIPVFRTPDAFTFPVAETTLAFILCDLRSIFLNDRVIKTGKWEKPQGYTLAEKKIGIIGFGKIGQAVAQRLLSFGVQELFVNDILDLDESILNKLNATQVSLETILEQCDVITLHCDLNKTSFHLLDENSFDKMKKTPFLINTARGPIVHEKALIYALKEGIVRGVALDVFENEPLALDNPLRKMDNVIASCHNSNSSPKHWDYVHRNSIKMLAEGLGVRR